MCSASTRGWSDATGPSYAVPSFMSCRRSRPVSDLVAPQALVVELETLLGSVRAAVAGHQWRGELVFHQTVAHLDDGAVVIGRPRFEGLALDRGLDVVQPVLGEQVG